MVAKQSTPCSILSVKGSLACKAFAPKCHGIVCRIQAHAGRSSLLGPRAYRCVDQVVVKPGACGDYIFLLSSTLILGSR